MYFTDTGEAIYTNNGKNCRPKFKLLSCKPFIDYVCKTMISNKWSVDAATGYAVKNNIFGNSHRVCTKTIYNYIDLALLKIRNLDLPMKLRRNTKPKFVRTNKRILNYDNISTTN